MPIYKPELFASSFDDAIAKKHLPGESLSVRPTANDEQGSNRRDSKAFLRAVKVRLKALGYLGKAQAVNAKLDVAYERAVKRFQRDVGLEKIDAWVGRKTWKMLEFLCSFENEQSPKAWLDDWCRYCNIDKNQVDLHSNQAVRRAVYLRLYAYGFLGADHELSSRTNLDPSSNLAFKKALSSFNGFCYALKLSSSKALKPLGMAYLERVFQYDQLLGAVSEARSFNKLQQNFRPQLEALSRNEHSQNALKNTDKMPEYSSSCAVEL